MHGTAFLMAPGGEPTDWQPSARFSGRAKLPGTIPNEEIWRGMVSGTGSVLAGVRRRNKRLPGSPRCKQCYLPLGGPLAWVFRLRGLRPSDGNPNFCNNCELFVREHPGGVEVEMAFLFADVRGSPRWLKR